MYHELEELVVIGIVDRLNLFQARFMVDGDWLLTHLLDDLYQGKFDEEKKQLSEV
ncbi:hypothetical protein [Paenibacillus luteus]|uniref:hypothetical protein n=1 Tax=Paenibacillus luteus TaxID=2545753 RepID=UPI0019D567BC|nr:hypothetical protein [Paenibacillus luteus]